MPIDGGFWGWVRGRWGMPVLAAVAACALAGQARAGGLVDVTASALAGDYQAQRNLAFGYSSSPYKGQDRSPLLACAWRLVIAHSGSTRVDQTDISNLGVYCSVLDKQQFAAAQAHGRQLYRRVYGGLAPF